MQKTKAKISAYVMVYDKDGMPRIDNPLSVPDTVWDKLPKEHKDWANAQCKPEFKRLKQEMS